MSERKKPKPDARLAQMAAILELRFGGKWRSEFPRSSGLSKPTIYSVFSGHRPLTEVFYLRLIAAIDAEIDAMAEHVKAAKALRRELK